MMETFFKNITFESDNVEHAGANSGHGEDDTQVEQFLHDLGV